MHRYGGVKLRQAHIAGYVPFIREVAREVPGMLNMSEAEPTPRVTWIGDLTAPVVVNIDAAGDFAPEQVDGITYRYGIRPEPEQIATLYRVAHLCRPIEDLERIRRTYIGSNVVYTAWSEDRLVGILRGWTDGAYDGYICDPAVDPEFQKLGIGGRLLERVRAMSPEIQWILRASEIARDYYAHLGWQRVENGWFWSRKPW